MSSSLNQVKGGIRDHLYNELILHPSLYSLHERDLTRMERTRNFHILLFGMQNDTLTFFDKQFGHFLWSPICFTYYQEMEK